MILWPSLSAKIAARLIYQTSLQTTLRLKPRKMHVRRIVKRTKIQRKTQSKDNRMEKLINEQAKTRKSNLEKTKKRSDSKQLKWMNPKAKKVQEQVEVVEISVEMAEAEEVTTERMIKQDAGVVNNSKTQIIDEVVKEAAGEAIETTTSVKRSTRIGTTRLKTH